MTVDGIHPKISIAESTRIELLKVQVKVQAKSAVRLGEMETCAASLCERVDVVSTLGSGVWLVEANDVYDAICSQWPNERMVKNEQHCLNRVNAKKECMQVHTCLFSLFIGMV